MPPVGPNRLPAPRFELSAAGWAARLAEVRRADAAAPLSSESAGAADAAPAAAPTAVAAPEEEDGEVLIEMGLKEDELVRLMEDLGVELDGAEFVRTVPPPPMDLRRVRRKAAAGAYMSFEAVGFDVLRVAAGQLVYDWEVRSDCQDSFQVRGGRVTAR